ncbi:hypothetical protein WMY93_011912 [Mugilogobius chulae]|uniref:Uncharacterized protein n=1 Tax=Mugilogobius chulae TaxID=88201 RepID=A0AAW0P736_9GOBI
MDEREEKRDYYDAKVRLSKVEEREGASEHPCEGGRGATPRFTTQRRERQSGVTFEPSHHSLEERGFNFVKSSTRGNPWNELSLKIVLGVVMRVAPAWTRHGSSLV